MDAGVGNIKTYMGTFCTVVWVIIILSYAAQKLDTLIGKKSITILSSVKEGHFAEDELFDYDQGLSIAVGFTAFDNQTTWSLDPSYGELVISSYEWGYRTSGTPFS